MYGEHETKLCELVEGAMNPDIRAGICSRYGGVQKIRRGSTEKSKDTA